MDWQQIASLAVVVITSTLLLRSYVRRAGRRSTTCAGGCSCDASEKLPRRSQ